ncbi:MAG: transcriptional regulator [Robiginitomaculum sp.]|nr:MAG: transcriptional regulator [Robiginitomaculum sp.]
MTKITKTIPVGGVFEKWRKDPAYVREFDALDEEFALAQLFISARSTAGLTQAELAKKMGTSQAYIARLEGGKEKPSTRTLQRFAKATGHRVVIEFERLAG